ncbi:uncharacterized protein LOC133889784 [Phragmites australis]|uniref:uncharacterized protein LOC133889784 n=1 Tax=Phragmites australis TaxID=29695 RepID=UPI002D78C093|nr:uncharacterized protein LOC133889784 [Phragmites australis]
MEAASVVGKLWLPPGFAFVPEDEEVVACYLLPRLQGQRLPIDGIILEEDPLSAPPWKLLKKHGRKGDAFFFAARQAMNGSNGSRQKRSCAGGGTWVAQKMLVDGEKLRVPGSGTEVAWRKYALNFKEYGVKSSTGWVMHEYSITAPPRLAASLLRVYRIRFSGHGKNGKNAKKRKRDEQDSDSDDEDGAARDATRHTVEETALFVFSSIPSPFLLTKPQQYPGAAAMEAASVVGKLGLPPGFAFVPEDEEVVAYYLLPRLQGQRLPIDGVILEEDLMSAPPWKLLKKHGRKGDAFFFAARQAMNGSRQKRSCAGGGTWVAQKKLRGGRDGEKLRVPGSGMEVAWLKYALNFHEDGVEGSTGWVMHEYSITAPPELAASPLRVYRIRFSGHGKNAKNRRDAQDSDSDDTGAAHAVTRPEVAETALFVGEFPSASQSVRSSPDGADVDVVGSRLFPR